MIKRASVGHSPGVVLARALSPSTPAPAATDRTVTADTRLTAMFTAHADVVWRSLRRLGVPAAAIDDATQEVFVVAQRRLATIEAGKERAFLLGTAVRVAADARRHLGRRRAHVTDEAAPDAADQAPTADELIDRKRARARLDEIIGGMADDTRAVFVLYELESLTMAEIATALALPPGTVASRLRRGREHFEAAIAHAARRDHG